MKDFSDYLESAKKSLFRFEYLQNFHIPEEQEYFREYKTTGQADVVPLMKEWWEFIESKRSEGVVTQRVRLVRRPLTQYTEWVLEVYKKSLEYGEDIRILNEEKLTPTLEALGDFWLIDDTIALKMNYGPTGDYLGFETVGNAKPYTEAKSYLLKHSTKS